MMSSLYRPLSGAMAARRGSALMSMATAAAPWVGSAGPFRSYRAMSEARMRTLRAGWRAIRAQANCRAAVAL